MKDFFHVFMILMVLATVGKAIKGCEAMFSQEQKCYTQGSRLNQIEVDCR